MTLIQDLKKRIQNYRDYVRTQDPFNLSVLDGSATAESISDFLVNIHYLVNRTPVHLKLASHVSQKNPDLHAFYENKIPEEQGHDQWALDDLQKVSKKLSDKTFHPAVTDEMKEFVKHIENTIRRDPYLYLPYIFFAEYFTVIYGPEFNRGILKCGHEQNSMTVITNHAELDKEHVSEWEQAILDLVDEKIYKDQYLNVVDKTIALHKKFFLSLAPRSAVRVAKSS